MAYTVLARRYRSQTFDDVVGQQAVAGTLKNAIASDRVAHAYLFVGTRGVGKTSMARIFAKALNGGSEDVDAAIMRGEDTDVIEIDAASNRSVEDARDLIANCVYKPLRGHHKIYIIDEVHMLTKDAFNTLLKVMEEPPEHVKFILCTTEPHKVLPTIQSRCQRFDFKNIAHADIVGHLKNVVDQEQLQADDDALHHLARLANGSMRDGLSILDRLIAAAPDGRVTDALIHEVLGLPSRELVARVFDAMIAGDAGSGLEAGDALLMNHPDMGQALEALASYARDCMVLAAAGAETPLVELAGDARSRAVEQAGSFDAAALSHVIALVESAQGRIKSASSPRALFDALLVRLVLTERIADVAALLSGGGSGPPAKKR